MNRAIVGLTLTLLLMVACGGGDDAADAEAGTVATTSASTSPTTPAADAAAVVAMEVSPCDLVTADEVAAATGLAVEEMRDEPPIDCVFDLGADAAVDIYVTIEDGQGRLAGPASLFEGYSAMVDDGEAGFVADVGEAAYCCPFRAIAVDAGGGRFIAVSVGGGYSELAEPRDVLISLAKIALGRL